MSGYAAHRKEANLRHQSFLSPYLHFGHISALSIALKVPCLCVFVYDVHVDSLGALYLSTPETETETYPSTHACARR